MKKPLRIKVLIVDDDFSTRRLIEKYIRDSMTCEIMQADDGSVAMQLMLKEEPSLVILDMVMPFMNGAEVLKTMKKNSRLAKTPVIACSTVDDPAVVSEMIKLGVNEYVVKPIDKEVLVSKMSKILDLKSRTAIPATA
jgi:response regulator RpfG family c-di-GMP phosphodiesterase